MSEGEEAETLDFPILPFSFYNFLLVLFPQSNGTKDQGGYLCHACVQQRLGPLTQLTISPELVLTMDVVDEVLEIPRHLAVLHDLF